MELDTKKNGAEIQAELLTQTGQRTVPSVWFRGEHIGGCDDTLAAIAAGKLAAAPDAGGEEEDALAAAGPKQPRSTAKVA